MLIGVIEAEQAERDQHADYARIDDAIRLAEQNIAALESRQLEPHETRKKWLAIRDRTILAIREARGNMIKRANEAKETRSWMIETFFRQSDVATPHEFSSDLQDVPTKGLLDYLNYLIRVGDVGRVQCIRVVFKARGDHHRYDLPFEKMLAEFALAEFGGFEERLTRICRLADEADAALAAKFAAHILTNRLQQLAVCTDYPARQTQDNLAA
jgi:hypothetical protein